MSGDPAHAVPGTWSGRHAGAQRSGAGAVSAPPLRYPGGFLRCPPVVLGEDQLHRALERGARRARAPREPFLELDLRHAEKGGELRPPALQELTLLENPGAHLRPSGVVDHCHGRATEQSAFQGTSYDISYCVRNYLVSLMSTASFATRRASPLPPPLLFLDARGAPDLLVLRLLRAQ